MAHSTDEAVANLSASSNTQFLQLITNILMALEEVNRMRVQHEIEMLLEEMALMEIPWHTQLMKLQQTIEADKDISDDVKEKLYDVIEKELKDKSREDIYADKGYDDLVRLIGKSKLSKADKEHVQDIIKECKYQMHDPYAMYLNRSEYIAMVKLLNESNMMSQVVPMQLRVEFLSLIHI